MFQDTSRGTLPKDSVWNMVDWLPDYGAMLRKRGGWSYGCNALAAGTYVAALGYAPFVAGSQLVVINDAGTAYKVNGDLTTTSLGASYATLQNPIFHRNTLIILASDGTSAAKSYDGTTLGALSGSPPTGKYGGVYKDRTMIANTTAQPQRVYFSDPGNPASWNTTLGFMNVSSPVVGLSSLKSAVLVFQQGRTERLRGTIPPPGSDMVVEGLFDFGCLDARSIVNWGDYAVWASSEGVFMTDGTIPVDLTYAGGMSQYWTSLMSAYTTSYTLAAGIIRDTYFLSVMNGSTFVDCLACTLTNRTWYRLANVKATMMARVTGTSEELYFGLRGAARVGKMGSIFLPTSSVKNDADGTAVTPVIETGFTPFGPRTSVKNLLTTYDCRDSASDDPTLTVSFCTSAESSSYTNSSVTLGETTAMTRKRSPISRRAVGVGFKITQTNASSDTRIYALDLDGHMLEESRGG